MLSVPQLVNIKGSDRVQFHRKAADQLIKLWQNWEDAALLPLVLTWDGSFVPRFIRGSRKTLSNHSFGSAFDINVAWNQLGVVPALAGQKGSVRELVQIANQHGFYWGGHFSRKDGMHFEVAQIK
jgi:D-alanyl-D-alanine dipeptidase